MRALKTFSAIVALSLLAAPAFARPNAPNAKAHAAETAKTKADRDARLLEALKRQGIDDARANKVVAIVKKFRSQKEPVRQDMKKHARALRQLKKSNSTDDSAYSLELQSIQRDRKLLGEVKQKQVAEVQQILKPSEQAKVMRLMHRGKAHQGKAHAKKSA